MFAIGLIWLSVIIISVVANNDTLPTLPFQNYDFEKADAIENANYSINYRLPNHTHPEAYDISINTRIDLSQFEFSGYVKIDVVCDIRTQMIVLHSRLLNVSEVKLSRLEDSTYVNVNIADFSYVNDLEFLTIKTNNIDLNPREKLLLEIAYSGTLRTTPFGFYRSSYKNSAGSTTWLATTHFEPNDARHAFPCYDEPQLKAKFTIRITHGKRFHALSNMPEKRNENPGDTATTSFAETQRMSTYLIAFVISDFAHISIAKSRPFRIYARPNAINLTTYALNIGEQVITEFENHLQVKYTYPKMDQIAVPDFAIGAMENWGLVLYQEKFLYWNETLYPSTAQFKMARTVAHEFSHQWFGNLVTPKWWTHTWLKEGFATLFQYIIIDLIHPDWSAFQDFQVGTFQPVMRRDASARARPMSYYADDPAAVKALFDFISYVKAGSVLYMLMHAFTEKTFKKALTYYLKEHSHNSTTEEDLFKALEKSASEDWSLSRHVDVYKLCRSWTNQAGYPVLTVIRDYNFNIITMSQSRFTSPSFETNQTWWIPYNYATARRLDFHDTRPFGWIPQGRRTMPIRGMEDLSWRDWIIFNKQQTSYYRVLYDDENYRLLSKQLNSESFGVLHVANRAQLIDDLYEFLKVGNVKVDIFMDLMSYLKRETDYAPWEPASRSFNELSKIFDASQIHDTFRAHVAMLSENYFATVGIDDRMNEAYLRKPARINAVNLACNFGVIACLNATRSKLNEVLNQNVNLPPNTKQIVFTNGARSATDDDLYKLWNHMLDATDKDERQLYLRSFGSINNQVIQKKYLMQSLQRVNGTLWPTERFIIFVTAYRNGQQKLGLCIEMLKNELRTAMDAYGIDTITSTILDMAEYVFAEDTKSEFIDLLHMLEENKHIDKRTISAAKTKINTNAMWRQKHLKDFEKWFLHHKSISSIQITSLSWYSLISIVFVNTIVNKYY